MADKTAQSILTQVKGLQDYMQPDEQPLLSLPAIWENGREKRGSPCDVVVTNQRLLAYYRMSFPRERLFLDALPLGSINNVSLRERNFAPIFRELMVSGDGRRVYIRAPRQKIEQLYAELRSAIETYAQVTLPISEEESVQEDAVPAPVFGRQEIRTQFERSNLGITLLFIMGVVLEIGGVLLWSNVGQSTGLPLCVAGFVMVLAAILQRWLQRR